MPESIQWTLNVAVVGGPRKAESKTAAVDVYLKGTVSIDAASGGTPATGAIDVTPDGGQVRFIMISASSYGPDPQPLSYTIGGGSALTLDGPLLLIGAGAVALLGTTNLSFEFTNAAETPATVEILVGRDAA